MPITYHGIDGGAQVTRGFVRVTLAGGFSLGDLLSGPFSDLVPWIGKVETWRAAVAVGFIVPARTSPAATSDNSGLVTPQSRAVVDVWILGAEQGLSYSQLANTMDRLVSRIDVLDLTAIDSLTDATGRSAVLQHAESEAAKETLEDKVFRFARKVALGVGLGLLALGAVWLFLNRRRP